MGKIYQKPQGRLTTKWRSDHQGTATKIQLHVSWLLHILFLFEIAPDPIINLMIAGLRHFLIFKNQGFIGEAGARFLQ